MVVGLGLGFAPQRCRPKRENQFSHSHCHLTRSVDIRSVRIHAFIPVPFNVAHPSPLFIIRLQGMSYDLLRPVHLGLFLEFEAMLRRSHYLYVPRAKKNT